MEEDNRVKQWSHVFVCPRCGSLFTKVTFQGYEVKLKHCGWCGIELDWTDIQTEHDKMGNVL